MLAHNFHRETGEKKTPGMDVSIKNWTGPYQRTPKLLEVLDTKV